MKHHIYACALFGKDTNLAHGLAVMDMNSLYIHAISKNPEFRGDPKGDVAGRVYDLRSEEFQASLCTISNMPAANPDLLFKSEDLPSTIRLGLQMSKMGLLTSGKQHTSNSFSVLELGEVMSETGEIYQFDPNNMNSQHLCFFMLINAFHRQQKILRLLS